MCCPVHLKIVRIVRAKFLKGSAEYDKRRPINLREHVDIELHAMSIPQISTHILFSQMSVVDQSEGYDGRTIDQRRQTATSSVAF